MDICSYRLYPNLHPTPQGSDSVVLGHGSGTGPADLATGKPGDCQTNLCCMVPEKLASRCDLRGPKFLKISALHAHNQLLARWLSQITGLKQTMEFLCNCEIDICCLLGG